MDLDGGAAPVIPVNPVEGAAAAVQPVIPPADAASDVESGELRLEPAEGRGPRGREHRSDLLLDNLVRAVEAAKQGADYDVTSAVRAPLSEADRARAEVDKWLTKAKIDKPTKFDGEPGEGSERIKSFLSELQR